MTEATPDPSGEAPSDEPAEDEVPSQKRRWLVRARRLVIDVSLFGILIFAVSAWTERGMLPADGAPAPSFALPGTDGAQVALAQLDGPLLVHFWATWCGVCSKQHAGFNRIADALPEGTQMVTIAVNSGGVSEVAAYAEDQGLTFPILVDVDGSVATSFGVTSYPSDFFLNADHEVVGRDVGYAPAWAVSLRLGAVR